MIEFKDLTLVTVNSKDKTKTHIVRRNSNGLYIDICKSLGFSNITFGAKLSNKAQVRKKVTCQICRKMVL